jgi:hypothetical protein
MRVDFLDNANLYIVVNEDENVPIGGFYCIMSGGDNAGVCLE